MAEIKTPLEKIITENGDLSYKITSQNTLNDVIRHLIAECGDDGQEIRHLVDEIIEENLKIKELGK